MIKEKDGSYFNWSSWTMRGKKKISGPLFKEIISVFTNFNLSLPIKSIHLRPSLMFMPSVCQQHRHLSNRLYGIKMDHIQWSGLGPVEIHDTYLLPSSKFYQYVFSPYSSLNIFQGSVKEISINNHELTIISFILVFLTNDLALLL